MLPLPSATDILASSSPTSNTVFSAFMQYGYMEVGVIVGALVILFIIGVFSGAFSKLFGGGDRYASNERFNQGYTGYTPIIKNGKNAGYIRHTENYFKNIM